MLRKNRRQHIHVVQVCVGNYQRSFWTGPLKVVAHVLRDQLHAAQ